MKRLLFAGLISIIWLMPTPASAQDSRCSGPFAEPQYQSTGAAVAKRLADTVVARARGAVLPGFALRSERLRQMQTGLVHDFFNEMLTTFEFKRDLRRPIEQFSSRYYRAEREADNATLQTLSAALFICFPDLARASSHISSTAERERSEQSMRREHAQREAQRAKEEAKREGQRLLEESEKKAALEKTPLYMLGNSYLNYIRLKKCEEVRQGYATIFVSEAEMERARLAVKRLEERLAPEINVDESRKSWTKETMWAEANRLTARDATPTRDSCQYQYRTLLERFRIVFPDAERVPKDF